MEEGNTEEVTVTRARVSKGVVTTSIANSMATMEIDVINAQAQTGMSRITSRYLCHIFWMIKERKNHQGVSKTNYRYLNHLQRWVVILQHVLVDIHHVDVDSNIFAVMFTRWTTPQEALGR
eukprot:snap_masked-scaffold_25-processed-gene-0.30-mRNA-1 protein AED:1.00 eAED:1.00 QI:0/-1/0/0/-1/1/1/0/120